MRWPTEADERRLGLTRPDRSLPFANRVPEGYPRPFVAAPLPTADLSFSCQCGASIKVKNQTGCPPDLARFGWHYRGGKYRCPSCHPIEERLR